MKRLLVGALLLSGACLGDLLVGPDPDVAPLLFISVRVTHGEELRYSVDAGLSAGSDSEGRPRALVDSFVVVEGTSVMGVASPGRLLRYTWSELATSPGNDTITIRGPVIAGLQTSGIVLHIPMPIREDPLFREHVAGDDLLLSVSPFADTIVGLVPGSAQWSLDIRDARKDQRILSLDGSGAHPAPLPIPWQLLMVSPGDSLTASLQSFSSHVVPNAPYGVSVLIVATIGWQIRIVAPPTP